MSRLFRTDEVSVGERVVVRRYLDGPGSHVTDVIGHVVSLDPLVLRPQKVGGLPSSAPTLSIPREQIQVLKRLSPRRVRNSDIRAIEVATAKAFPGQEHTLIDGWFTRAGADIAERSNSATPIGPSAGFRPVPIREIHEFYASRGLPTRLLVPERIGAAAEKLLVGAGEGHWSVGPEIITMTTALHGSAAADEPIEAEELSTLVFEVTDEPDEDWLAMYHFRGQPLPPDALRALAKTIDGKITFGRLKHQGQTIAVTRGTLTSSSMDTPSFDSGYAGVGMDGGRGSSKSDVVWLGYSAVEVAPAWRRRGVGTLLGRKMRQWGREHGATNAYLQVLGSNEAGLRLYRKLGFEEHHRLRYFTLR
ncbi:N-acetylglutamate synthase, CG3035 family [Corynebacterium aquatimens]|uniref:N-acetylglutamate synthase, CG3035 family n=1 Tax=Corynebacterium aquatimens TaxID=1190508 RepID=UPI0018C98D02|nr:GNAT family N-acetyltransferase [Corynebacterium aquatimens]